MNIASYARKVVSRPADLVRGMAAGLDGSTKGTYKEKNISWTTGYVVGQLGPWAVIPVTVWAAGKTGLVATILACA